MPDLEFFADRLHYDGHREYTKAEGDVNYLDGTPLKRPIKMPLGQRAVAIIIVIVGIIIGLMLVNNLVIQRWQQNAAAEQAIIDNLAREASAESVPNMASLVHLANEDIKATFDAAGYQYFDMSESDESNDMVLYKMPSDVPVAEGADLYRSGVGTLTGEEASRLLTGGWYFAVDRAGGTSMVVRYVDFTTGDPKVAVQNAVNKQGFDAASITESGVDESDNTFSTGTVTADEQSCIWRVSALPLAEIYSISGLPEDACYVGVRING